MCTVQLISDKKAFGLGQFHYATDKEDDYHVTVGREAELRNEK